MGHSPHILFKQVLSFFRKDFHLFSYLYIALFACTLTYLAYYTDLYKSYTSYSYQLGYMSRAYFVLYSFIYFAAIIPILLIRKERNILKKKDFYLKSLLFIAIYSFAVGFSGHQKISFSNFSEKERTYLYSILGQLKGFFISMPLLFLVKNTIDKNIKDFYGLSRSKELITNYFILFLLMLPVLIWASTTEDFMSFYPRFKYWNFKGIFEMPTWLYSIVFESAYALDFVSTELFFRGALVIGLSRFLDRKTVLPMVVLYVVIHFEKPLLETISSAFGGYILGALAYQTKHIWGGIVIHICVALAIEFLGIFTN